MKMPSLVACSATMTVNQEFEHYKRQVGLNVTNEALTVNSTILPTPFDYKEQALLALPIDLPNPNSPDYLTNIVPFLEHAYTLLEGVSSYSAPVTRLFKHYTTNVSLDLKENMPFLSKGKWDAQLLQAFVNTRAVLLAQIHFGRALVFLETTSKMVIIPRLPFRVPRNLVHKRDMNVL